MSISKISFACKEKSLFDQKINVGAGHIVPHAWYHLILRSGGKPDMVGIAILSELLYLSRKTCARVNEFQVGYEYLKRKFNFTQDQIYEALVRLDGAGLVTRTMRSTIIHGRKFSNELFLTLHLEKLAELHAKDKNNKRPDFRHFEPEVSDCNNCPQEQGEDSSYCSSSDRSSNCHSITSSSVSNLSNLTSVSTSVSASTSVSGSSDDRGAKFFTSPMGTSVSSDLESSGFLLKGELREENREKNRSRSRSESTFKNFQKVDEIGGNGWGLLSDFHPLNETDRDALQTASGREFSLNFMNQLLLRLADKYPGRQFYGKEQVLKYMSKALSCEKRDAVFVSGNDFRFGGDCEEGRKEAYLRSIEQSGQDNSYIAQVRRKIAGVFDLEFAYLFILGPIV